MRIVCSIDESAAARNAARVAERLADRMEAELVFVHSKTGESSPRVGAHSDRRCGLLIVGFEAPTRLSSMLLGDAYRRLARDAGCPVLVVPATAQLRPGTNVVLGYDLPTISSEEAAVAAGERLDVRHVQRQGRASAHLDAVATDHDGAVIVVGTQRPGWRAALRRSVATRLQRHERHPVIVVPRRASLVGAQG